MHKRISIARWLSLVTGLSFYSAIGVLFLIPSPEIRGACFLLVLATWRFPPISVKLVLAASIITGAIEGLLGTPVSSVVVPAFGWACITGTVLVGMVVYPQVFQGGDWAAIAIPFGRERGTNIAHVSFFLFKVIPELEDRLRRIVHAFQVYGFRKNLSVWYWPFLTVLDGLITYFLECVDLLLAFERVALRRHSILFEAARSQRKVRVRSFVGCWLFVGVAIWALVT